MATFNELAVLIAEPLGRELDEAFKEQLKARIKYWRAKLLRDTLQRNPKDRQFFTQRITVAMSEISAVDCNLPLSCKMMATPVLPNIIRANGIIFDYIGAVDGSNPFKLVQRWEIPFMLTNKYLPLVSIFAAWENKRIILPKNNLIANISIEAIFDDPEAAAELGCDGSGDCDFEAAEYPINEELAQMIVQYILQVDFNRRPADENKTEINVDSPNPQQA